MANKKPKTKASTIMHDVLIEIGTEELPANYLVFGNQAHQALFREAFTNALKPLDEYGAYAWDDLRIYLTPRRIALHIPKLCFESKAVREKVYGPPQDRAFDSEGKPSPMLLGFAKSKGIAVESMKVFDNNGKTCMGYERVCKPLPFKTIVGEWIEGFLKGLSFPKLMHWDEGRMNFPRPIRSMLILVDGKALKIKVGNFQSSTRAHAFANATRVAKVIQTQKIYFSFLKQRRVILDQRNRRDKIKVDVERAIHEMGGVNSAQEDLLDEITYLTEDPIVVSGAFDASFANLPPEVLTSSLSKAQRLFSVKDKKNKHLPYFVAVLDGKPRSTKQITKNIAAILKAKLMDSHFFYQEDLKVFRGEGLSKLQEELKSLLYIRGMGSMHNKAMRLLAVAKSITPQWGLGDSEIRDLLKAIPLAKTDLLTHMVGEMPELQGVVGAFYLKHSLGPESSRVANAVGEHYLPLSPVGKLPQSLIACALSILDKADLIVSCFILGKAPTSSQDPYALKRAMASIIRIAGDKGITVDWKALTQNMVHEIEKSAMVKPFEKTKVITALHSFYHDRLIHHYENKGYERELVDAVVSVHAKNLSMVYKRIESLKKMRKNNDFKQTMKVVQRTSNILKGAKNFTAVAVNRELFLEDLESDLWTQVETHSPAIIKAIEQDNIPLATSLYAKAFFAILHAFFDQVLVNVEDEKVKQNRLSMMLTLRNLYTHDIADLSKLKTIED